MMKSVSAAEANRSFSKLLGSVDRGEEFLITSRGRPVARLVPAATAEQAGAKAKAAKKFFGDLAKRPVRNFARITRGEIYDYLD